MLIQWCNRYKEHKPCHVSLKGKMEIITIDSSDFKDVGITQIKSDDDKTNLQPLRDAGHQNHKVATQLQLTHKTEKPTVPERIKAFLKAHELACQQDPSKLGTILFKCELVLQKQTGQKQGTRVPMETWGFSIQKVSDMFQFPRWLLTPKSLYRRSMMCSTNLRWCLKSLTDDGWKSFQEKSLMSTFWYIL